MLYALACFLLVLGLIGFVAYMLKYLHKNNFLKKFIPALTQKVKINQIAIDSKRKIVTVEMQDAQYIFLFSANNDILLDKKNLITKRTNDNYSQELNSKQYA